MEIPEYLTRPNAEILSLVFDIFGIAVLNISAGFANHY